MEVVEVEMEAFVQVLPFDSRVDCRDSIIKVDIGHSATGPSASGGTKSQEANQPPQE